MPETSTPTEAAAGTTEAPAPAVEETPEDGIVEESLVEEVSIDGMCGVY